MFVARATMSPEHCLHVIGLRGRGGVCSGDASGTTLLRIARKRAEPPPRRNGSGGQNAPRIPKRNEPSLFVGAPRVFA
jgi:hypothetical protein